MSEEQDNQEDKTKNKKRLVQADKSLSASVILVTCDKCGKSFTKLEFSSHYCG